MVRGRVAAAGVVASLLLSGCSDRLEQQRPSPSPDAARPVDAHGARGSTVEDDNRQPADHREVESRPVYQSTDVSAYGASCSDRVRVTGTRMVEVLALISAPARGWPGRPVAPDPLSWMDRLTRIMAVARRP